MRRRMVVHRAMMPVVMNNPVVLYRVMGLGAGKTGQTDEQGNDH
jgi:hypothetical protein